MLNKCPKCNNELVKCSEESKYVCNVCGCEYDFTAFLSDSIAKINSLTLQPAIKSKYVDKLKKRNDGDFEGLSKIVLSAIIEQNSVVIEEQKAKIISNFNENYSALSLERKQEIESQINSLFEERRTTNKRYKTYEDAILFSLTDVTNSINNTFESLKVENAQADLINSCVSFTMEMPRNLKGIFRLIEEKFKTHSVLKSDNLRPLFRELMLIIPDDLRGTFATNFDNMVLKYKNEEEEKEKYELYQNQKNSFLEQLNEALEKYDANNYGKVEYAKIKKLYEDSNDSINSVSISERHYNEKFSTLISMFTQNASNIKTKNEKNKNKNASILLALLAFVFLASIVLVGAIPKVSYSIYDDVLVDNDGTLEDLSTKGAKVEGIKGLLWGSFHLPMSHVKIEKDYKGYPVNVISKSAFKDNKSIIDITLPETIQVIGDSAFENCNKLEHINCINNNDVMLDRLPENIKVIGNNFINNTSVKSLTIPKTIETICEEALENTNKLNVEFLGTSGQWESLYANNNVNIEFEEVKVTILLPSSGENHDYSVVNTLLLSRNVPTIYESLEDVKSLINTLQDGYTFIGWSYDNDLTVLEETKKGNSISCLKDTNLYAVFANNEYKLIFDSNGGSKVEDIDVIYNNSYNLNKSVKDGYVFKGWLIDNQVYEDNLLWDFTSNKTATALWNPILTIKGNDCDKAAIIVENGTQEETLIDSLSTIEVINQEVSLTVIEKNGYSFDGWYNENNQLLSMDKTYVFNVDIPLTLSAKWTYYTITISSNNDEAGTVSGLASAIVTFDLNDETSNVETQVVTDLNGIKYPDIPTRKGYVFKGWYSDKECIQLYDFTSSINDNIRLYAKWEKVEEGYTTYMVDISTKYNNADDAFILSTDQLSTYSNSYIYFVVNTSGEHTIYYSVDYYSTSQHRVYIAMENKTQKTLIKSSNYMSSTSTYSIRFTANAGDIIRLNMYKNSQTSPINFSFYVTGDEVILDGGKCDPLFASKVTAGEEVTLKAIANQGYTWLGWYDEDNLISKDLEYTFTMSKNNISYVAKWTYYTITISSSNDDKGIVSGLASATVTFDFNDVTIDDQIQIVTDLNGIKYPDVPTRKGYIFNGWNSDKECTQPYDFTSIVNEDIRLYAKWEKVEEGYTNYTIDASKCNSLDNAFVLSTDQLSTYSNSYIYFVVNTSGEHTIYYSVDYYSSSQYRVFVGIENKTQKTSIKNSSYISSTAMQSIKFTANAGDIIRLSMYKSNQTSPINFTFYVTGEERALDGGKCNPLFTSKVTVGEEVTIIASAKPGYTFVGWYDGEQLVSDLATYTFIMEDNNVNYVARFEEIL